MSDTIALLDTFGMSHLFRWLHVWFGIIWIGTLYYFNFIQGPFFAETDANTKTGATAKLLPRALWWFRYGALLTFITGLYLLHKRAAESVGPEGNLMSAYVTPWGIQIMLGAALGTIMFLNVWFIIWPKQKIVFTSAQGVLEGKPANPAAAACGARALVASRTNTMFSIPMLYFMLSANHLPVPVGVDANLMTPTILFAVILGALEINAIKGKLGPLTTVRGVITSGFVLTAILYGLLEVLT